MVMGTCVYHVAHRSLGNVLSNVGQNTELPQFTQALYDARELAMERMQRRPRRSPPRASSGCSSSQHNHAWGGHTTEFFAVGTAVRPIRPDHVVPAPQLVLGLER